MPRESTPPEHRHPLLWDDHAEFKVHDLLLQREEFLMDGNLS